MLLWVVPEETYLYGTKEVGIMDIKFIKEKVK